MRKLILIVFFILLSWLILIGSIAVTIKIYDYIHPTQEQGIPVEEVEFYHSYHGIGMRVDGTCMSSWEDPSGWWFINEKGKKCKVRTESAVKAYEWHKKNKDFKWNLRVIPNEK